MSEVSVIELIVYGLVGYSGLILLIASAFKELPAMKSQSIVRSIWILAPIFAMYMLANAGQDVWVSDSVTTTVIKNLNTTETFTETVQNNSKITLYQPVWVTLHLLFFFMLIIYFIWNMLMLFVKRD